MKTDRIWKLNPSNVEDIWLNWLPPCCLLSWQTWLQSETTATPQHEPKSKGILKYHSLNRRENKIKKKTRKICGEHENILAIRISCGFLSK